jgi:hypothetical protein
MTPYYQSPDGKIRLYLGDCREILPVVAPPSDNVIVLADPPYGVNENTDRLGNKRGLRGNKTKRFALSKGAGPNGRQWKPVAGDSGPFDPQHLLAYSRLLVWGWNHFCGAMPPTPSTVVWFKRPSSTPDDNADLEEAWTNLGGPARCFAHLWRGSCRASETGAVHLHPTQKPEAFYRWLFAGRGRGKPIVNPGDLVVSPYLGSGPEIAPTMELGLKFIGIDVEREYLDTAIKHRIEPALVRAKQLDIWAPKPKREEQLALV